MTSILVPQRLSPGVHPVPKTDPLEKFLINWLQSIWRSLEALSCINRDDHGEFARFNCYQRMMHLNATDNGFRKAPKAQEVGAHVSVCCPKNLLFQKVDGDILGC